MNNLNDLLAFTRFIISRFRQDRCAQIAASLTFTTLLSLVPLLAIVLTLLSAFRMFDDVSGHIREFVLANLMPETGAKLVTRYVQQFAENAARLTAFGIATLTLTAMLMMLTIDNAFNAIWRVSRPRPLVQRLLVYWAVLTLAPLLVGASLSLTSWLTSLSVGYAREIPAFSIAMLKVIPVILTTLAFSLLFRIVPNRYVPHRHAYIGAVIAAVAFESMNRAFAFYVAHFPTYKLVYGAFASIPIFLLWIYLSWLTILFGALITASLSHWRSRATSQPVPAVQLYYALRILLEFRAALEQGKVLSLPDLSRRFHVGFDSIEQVLEKLARADMVRKLAGSGWVMIRDAGHIRLSELFRVFVFDPADLANMEDEMGIRSRLESLATLPGKADMSLDELFSLQD